MIKYTTRLYSMPSWLSGVASIFDLGGTLNEYNFASDPAEADYLAIASDWAAIGADLQAAIDSYKVQEVTDNGKESTKEKRRR